MKELAKQQEGFALGQFACYTNKRVYKERRWSWKGKRTQVGKFCLLLIQIK
jgi:hypothetical protein